MRCRWIILALLALSVTCVAQKLYVYQAPTSSSSGPFQALFGTVLPHASGITVPVLWGTLDVGTSTNCTTTNPCGPCQEGTWASGDTVQCDWSAIDPTLLQYIYGPTGTAPCNGGICSLTDGKLNLVLDIIPEGNGGSVNEVPAYVFQPSTYSSKNWCTGCAPQDMSTCGTWAGDNNAPTCGSIDGKSPCDAPQTGYWNINSGTCHYFNYTASAWEVCTNGSTSDTSGYPVLYEAPFMAAYQSFIKQFIKHYSPTGGGASIAQYLGYIRIGLAQGGENDPSCAAGVTNGNNPLAIWPGPEGLTLESKWFATSPLAVCSGPQSSPILTSYPSECKGKDAYLYGVTYGPGYVKQILKTIQAAQAAYPNSPATPVMINSHDGPPYSSDPNYADGEAYIASLLNNATSPLGFGMESLSVGDTSNPPTSCANDWCANFSSYEGANPKNLYLQTTTPNSEPTYPILNIAVASNTATVTCGTGSTASACTSATGGITTGAGGLIPEEWVLIQNNTGTGVNGYYEIVGTPAGGTTFTYNCPNSCVGGTGGIIYTGDFLPYTIPTAHTWYADMVEVYFCDWAYAFEGANSQIGNCPLSGAYSTDYSNILTSP
jgi:hypothetical protein